MIIVVTRPNVFSEFGILMPEGSTQTVSDSYGSSLVSTLQATVSPLNVSTKPNRPFDQIPVPDIPVGVEYKPTGGFVLSAEDVPLVEIDASRNIVLGKSAGSGLKVSTDDPVFGWRDLTAPVDVRGVGANDPTFAVYTGTTMRAYQFSASTMNEVFFTYHVPHDWVPGTDVYFHAHWSNAAAAPNTGAVVWKFDYTFAKGFSQEAFPVIQTVEVIAASPATRYMHNVSETGAVSIPLMEVDGLLLVRGYRDAANVLDTCSDAVFLHTMDIHYQSTNMATVNKAPSFYGA